MKYIGNWLICFSLCFTLVLYFCAKTTFNLPISFSWVAASQIISLIGTVLLCFSFLLSGSFMMIESLFGGLDKVYKVHHIVGGIAFVFLLHHPLFLVVNALPNINLSYQYVWFSKNLTYNYGLISLYFMLLMLIFTLLINLPYSIWKKTHELMGLGLLFASLHILTISSDVSRYLPLRYWIIFLLVTATWSVIYKRFLYGLIGPKYKYVVEKVKRTEDVIEVFVKPMTKQMKYRAGQFAFVTFDKLSNESHPFSISSGSNQDTIRFGMKILGDYTIKLKELVQGDKLTLFGPYGKFFQGIYTNKDLVWIAGGIGITPFMGLIDGELLSNQNRTVDLFYCVKTEDEGVFDNEIKEKVAGNNFIKYRQFCSIDNGRLSANKLLEMLGTFSNKRFMLCGPVPMMESLSKQLKLMGVRNSDILFEDFNFK